MPDVSTRADVSETGVAHDFKTLSRQETAKAVYTIGEVAKEFGVTHRALRFYEDRGLLHPKREGQTRLYSRRDVARLKLVLMGKRVGFSLTEIREMLDLYDLRDGQVLQLRVALEKFEQQIAVLEQQQRDVQQALGDLRRTREIVAGMLTEKEKESDS